MDITRSVRGETPELRLARGLGWFSIALGVAELVAPGKVSEFIGTGRNDGLLRAYGVREIAAGVGLLTAQQPSRWLWARVAGDALDLATLSATDPTDPDRRDRRDRISASIVAVTLVDLAAAVWVGRSGR